ncbi:MAG: SurA N-terminal domain-containing protein [Proteobacteria bacterium]|nr:SurA N-terminal domain-containing protein [Pseudomonadota bacterium]
MWPAFSGAELIDRVVAEVNDDVITLSELEKAGESYFKRIRDNAPANEVKMALEKARVEVLASLVDKMLLRQEAGKMSISVSEAEIDMAIDQILARNKATIEDFRKDLAAMHMTEHEFREDLRDQILQSKLSNYQIRSRLVITEEDIQEYYQKQYTKETQESGYYILQMGFTWEKQGNLVMPGTVAKQDARKRAEEIRDRVLDGESFKELAKSFSNLPSAKDGGDIGLIKKDEMAQYMRDTVLPIKPGEVSPIVETESGFQFFKLLSVREGDMVILAPYESVRVEIRDLLYQEEIREQYDKWVKELREKAYIKTLL